MGNHRRNDRRTPGQEFVLYKPPSSPVACWAFHGRISKERGDKLVAAGEAEIVVDPLTGELDGYRLFGSKGPAAVKNGIASKPTPAVLTVREMDLIAGTKFKHGRSRTAGMSEIQRLTRVHPISLKLLPPEDEIERAAAKLLAVTPRHLQQFAAAD